MAELLRQFTIKKLREPVENKLSEDIEWVCNSLGVACPRD